MARDYFAEMYVAGILADNGWNIYFPRKDIGFDFIITKTVAAGIILRPVQVKGKYPQVEGRNLPAFGYIGPLSQLHQDMVLAIPYFSTNIHTAAPEHVAYMPRTRYGYSEVQAMLAVQRAVVMEKSSHAGIFESILIPKECSSWNPPIGVKAKTSITTILRDDG